MSAVLWGWGGGVESIVRDVRRGGVNREGGRRGGVNREGWEEGWSQNHERWGGGVVSI